MSLRILFIVLAFVFAAPVAHTQDEAPDETPFPFTQLWLEAGVGYGGAGAGPNTEAGGHISGRAAIRAMFGQAALIARVTATTGGASDFSRFVILGPSTIYDGFFDAGVLLGYILPLNDDWEAAGAVGAAVVWGSRATRSRCFDFCFSSGWSQPFTPTVGLPLEVGLTVDVRGPLRLGLLGYANVNAEETFGGLLLSGTFRAW